MQNILIGGAWPSVNGSLHIGHLAALLPGDVIARYYRSKGNTVVYVSGSDCYGSAVEIRGRAEKRSPHAVSEYYHSEFCEIFRKLGFSYDLYGKTSDKWHIDFVRNFHRKLYESKYVYEKTVPHAFCKKCNKALVDRMIVGKCPVCGEETNGEQCDFCGEAIDAENIVNPRCAQCKSFLVFEEKSQLFISLSQLKKELAAYLAEHPTWRNNATAFTKRYIDEGLRDKAITRDLGWGIDVPKEGYEGKKIYIWAENVLGYLSASRQVCEKRGISFDELWGENSRHYYVHGKDNIPFHTIILPSLLIASGEKLHLPDEIISSEHMTLDGSKISTSKCHAIWAKDIVDSYNPDALRCFFILNGPEKRDTDFSWHEFILQNNSELVGAYGNFVNRTLVFIEKYFNSLVPNGHIDGEIQAAIEKAFCSVGQKIENGQLKSALSEVFELVRFGNKYYDAEQPWKTRTENPRSCENTLFNCVQLVTNLAVLFCPFLPFSSQKVFAWIGATEKWTEQYILPHHTLPQSSVLFSRIEKKADN